MNARAEKKLCCMIAITVTNVVAVVEKEKEKEERYQNLKHQRAPSRELKKGRIFSQSLWLPLDRKCLAKIAILIRTEI